MLSGYDYANYALVVPAILHLFGHEALQIGYSCAGCAQADAVLRCPVMPCMS